MVLVILKIIGKLVPVVVECGRTTEADTTVVPLVDGRADSHTEEVHLDCGSSRIYEMTLCKTEKNPDCCYYSS